MEHSRQVRRHIERDTKERKLGTGPGRRNKWLQRHPKLAPFYVMAINYLKNGERAQQPTWRAIRKMMVILATSERVHLPSIQTPLPWPITLPTATKPSWRSFPSTRIDANLAVAQ